jgi:hypothetical protein
MMLSNTSLKPDKLLLMNMVYVITHNQYATIVYRLTHKLSLFNLLIVCLLLVATPANAQLFAGNILSQPADYKTAFHQSNEVKPINYNSLGALIPLHADDIIIGGTSVVFKRLGTFLTYKVGVKNWMMPEHGELGNFTKKNVVSNGWTITGNRQEAVTLMLSGGLSFAIFKKAPFYVGAGFTRYRPFFEYIDPMANKPKWNVDTEQVRFELNYSAGMFIPIVGRLLLNVGYDHNPQSVFVGLSLRGIYAYEDIDEWR